MVSGELDDVTTPHEGHLVAEEFPDARQYIARNAGHVASLYDGHSPAAKRIRRFLTRNISGAGWRGWRGVTPRRPERRTVTLPRCFPPARSVTAAPELVTGPSSVATTGAPRRARTSPPDRRSCRASRELRRRARHLLAVVREEPARGPGSSARSRASPSTAPYPVEASWPRKPCFPVSVTVEAPVFVAFKSFPSWK